MSIAAEELLRAHGAAVARVHARAAEAGSWLDRDALAGALARSLDGRFGETGPTPREIEAHLESLHAADLALAEACRLGSSPAWHRFVEDFRPVLHAAARKMGGGEERARDLADGLWADLWGVVEREGERRSLLAWYQGRSSLAAWLRSVVARRHVDRWREERRRESLDEPERAEPAAPAESDPACRDPDEERWLGLLRVALDSALAALPARERLRLSLYHLEGTTLAEIGKLFGEHESTVSRKLDRLRRQLRKTIERSLRRDHGLGTTEIAECLERATRDWPFDLGPALGERS